MSRTLLIVVALALVSAACSTDGGEAVLTAGPGNSEVAGAAVAAAGEPKPEAASTVAVTSTVAVARPAAVSTTVPVHTTLPPGVPWPAGVPRDAPITVVYGPEGPTTTTIPRRSPPPGVTALGSGDVAWSKVTTVGSVTVDFRLYPADIYLDGRLTASAEVTFTGAPRSVHLDWGDGTSYDANDFRYGMPCTVPATHYDGRWVINNVTHNYSQAGIFNVTATITIADCTPPPWLAGPPPTFLLPNGMPMPPPQYPAMGNDTVVTTSLSVKVHPVRQPVVIHINNGPG